MKKKDYTVTIIVVVGLFLLTMLLLAAVAPKPLPLKPKITFTHKRSTAVHVPYAGKMHIKVIDQSIIDNNITVLSAALKENGYMVVHKAEKGKADAIIGVSPLLASGLYSVRFIPLMEPAAQGDTLFVMLYSDDGDGAFSSEVDQPFTDNDGVVIMNKFVVL
jgi:hypothetical protein